MLKDIYFMVITHFKGPVCRGQIALNVIQDHFWVVHGPKIWFKYSW